MNIGFIILFLLLMIPMAVIGFIFIMNDRKDFSRMFKYAWLIAMGVAVIYLVYFLITAIL